jgi:beta-1,4-mannosyl-glycoprotein beta-1,4-N-acetylglucosaminyltransferase
MLTYDLFMYYDERELLDIRLQTLKDVVDVFVLCEADKDFRGRPKPLHFEWEQIPLDLRSRVRHLVCYDDPPMDPKTNKWRIENAQRRYLIHGISDAKDDDLIMLSDVDEIPRPDVPKDFLGRSKNTIEFRGCRFTQYMYWMNGWFSDRVHATTIMTRRYLRDELNDDLKTARERRRHGRLITASGWHFHAIGGTEAVLQKLSITAHSQYDSEENRREAADRIEAGIPYYGDTGMRIEYVPIDGRFPSHAVEHYRHLFKEVAHET